MLVQAGVKHKKTLKVSTLKTIFPIVLANKL